MTKVAVIGGGFGGVYAIKRLQRLAPDADIQLFEPRDRFVFTPLLHEVAADVLHAPSVTHEYSRIFHRGVRHVRSVATRVDLGEKRVIAGGREHPFDYVIIAHGSRTRMPEGIDALELKDIDDALAIRRCVERSVLHAAQGGELLPCVIVGGGPTGVELAAEIIGFYGYRLEKEHCDAEPRVLLVQSQPDILHGADDRIVRIARARLERLGVEIAASTRVVSVKDGLVRLKGRRTIRAGCVVWAAGVVPNDLDVRGIGREGPHVPVDETLQVKGHTFALAIGDASLMPEPMPDQAQVAVQQGVHAAKTIARLMAGKPPRRFTYRPQGFLLSLGQRYGAGTIRGFAVHGFLAWFIWRTVYLLKFVGVRSRMRMAMEYTVRLFRLHPHH